MSIHNPGGYQIRRLPRMPEPLPIPAPTADQRLIVIQANTSLWRLGLAEINGYRDLLFLLVKRDLTAMYKQTILGPLWFVIQPLIMTVVFTVIFGTVAQVDVGEVPHFVFYLSGLVFWNFFQGILTYGAGSLVGSAKLLSKVYFPRLIIPLTGVFTQFAHLALNFVTFLSFYLWFYFQGADIAPNKWLFLLPVHILHGALVGFGFGLWVSALTIKYRDLQFALPLVTQLWLYATPIVYPASMVVTPLYEAILWLNPMTAVVEYGRMGFIGGDAPDLARYLQSWGITLAVLLSGLYLFNWVQRTFVDKI